METLLQDLTYGVRLLRRAPAFAAAAILTVALGIGATTAMFSVVYGVVLRPLPFGDPDRLVNVWTVSSRLRLTRAYVGAANARDWRRENEVFEDLALVRTIGNFNLVGQGEPERLAGARITANLFPVLQVSPLLGRAFVPRENEIGHEHVVLLSHGLWQRRFGGDPGVVGRKVTLNGDVHEIVGVMRPDFTYPGREFQLWVPLTINPADYTTRGNYAFVAVARLKPGVTLEQARSNLGVISERLAREYPGNDGVRADVVPMLADTVAQVRTPLYGLLGAAAAMLLIGCANLANLLLARSLARQRELAVRAALGASRGRLIVQAVIELVPMLVVGGGLGLAAAYWTLRSVVPWLPADMPRVEDIGMHLPVLATTACTLAAVAVLTGLWPALEAARSGLSASAADVSRGTAGGSRPTRVRDILVVVQVATTMMLLVTAMLLIRSFDELRQVKPGFNPDRVLSVHLAIPRTKYTSDQKVAEFCQRILERVQSLPGVVSAGMVNRLPFGGVVQIGTLVLEGDPASEKEALTTDWRSVTPDYFRTLEIPLVQGRAFTDQDDATKPPVGIIDQRIAHIAWPGADPIGRRFRIPVDGLPWVTIVGVVGHIRHERLDDDSRPQVYWPSLQRAQDRMALVVKTEGEPSALASSIAVAIRELDPDQPVYDVRPLNAVIDRSLARRWLQTTLLGVFAALALVLASIGVYGVMAYAVGQRLREFGIRLALGARRADIVKMVVGRGAALFVAGAAIGALAAAGAVRLLAAFLYNVGRFDPVSFAVSGLVLLLVTLAASSLPARRASRVDPSVALRAE